MTDNRKRLALFSLSLLLVALLGCSTTNVWGANGVAAWGAMAMNAAAGIVNQLAGVPLLTTSASAPGACPASDPPTDPQSEGFGGGSSEDSTCSPSDGDDPCVACAKSQCCDDSAMCFDDDSCVCNIACNTTGPSVCPASKRANCGPEDDVYDTLVSCLVEHCKEECPNQ